MVQIAFYTGKKRPNAAHIGENGAHVSVLIEPDKTPSDIIGYYSYEN
jgi:hypothetical protein